MRKAFYTLITTVLVFIMLSSGNTFVHAAEPASTEEKAVSEMRFQYELSVDGKDTKEVEPGDIITVVLKLKRSDKTKNYTMHAMQAEIRYDSTFLELVDNSAVLSPGIVSTDVAMVDQYREFYMNFLSMGGGEQWEADELIGSFQLKVIGEQGVTGITCEDYLVSLPDGSGSYACEANELLIILSTDCVVSFHTNGGSELEDVVVQFGEKLARPEDPVREGYVLEGWYTDIHLTEKWDFDKDVVEGNMSLYAKWVEAAANTGDSSNIYLWITLLVIAVLACAYLLIKRKRAEE